MNKFAFFLIKIWFKCPIINYFSHRRRPSWTDRILYKVNAADIYDDIKIHTEQHTYKSHPNYSVSDHKPVTGEFDIVVKTHTQFSYMCFFFLPSYM